MTDLKDLIERLEAAEEGSRELDCLIHAAVVNPDIMTDPGDYQGERPVRYTPLSEIASGWGQEWRDLADLAQAPHYTTSLDAALPGENIVWLICLSDGRRTWEAGHEDPENTDPDHGITYATARTEPLARRLAYLKSLPEKES